MEVLTEANPTSATVIEPLGSIATADAEPSSDLDDSGRLLDGCRQYLLMIANQVIGPEIRAKVGASDLVQDTFVERSGIWPGFAAGPRSSCAPG